MMDTTAITAATQALVDKYGPVAIYGHDQVNTIFAYVTRRSDSAAFKDLTEWHGFRVSVKYTGQFRPATT